jgi:small subunit ribosomal protein S6
MKSKGDEEVKETKTNVYEVGYLLVPTVLESNVSTKVDAFRKVIELGGGRIIAEGGPVLQDLAYEMSIIVSNKKEIHSSGYFGWIKFEGNSDQIKKINSFFKKDSEVIRFVITKTILEDSLAIINKILAAEVETKARVAIKEEEKVLELKNKHRKEENTKKAKERPMEAISTEELDETIDKLIAE